MLLGRLLRSEGGSIFSGLVLLALDAAILASLSASSLPKMLEWPAIQFRETCDLVALF